MVYQLSYLANWGLIALVAQHVELCTDIAEVMCLNPVQALISMLTNSTFINLKNARLVLNAKCEIPSRFTSVIVLR